VVNSLAFKRFVHTVLQAEQELEWEKLARPARHSVSLLDLLTAEKGAFCRIGQWVHTSAHFNDVKPKNMIRKIGFVSIVSKTDEDHKTVGVINT